MYVWCVGDEIVVMVRGYGGDGDCDGGSNGGREESRNSA